MIAGKVMGEYINGDGKKIYQITDIFQEKHELTYAEVLDGLIDKTVRLNNMEVVNGELKYKEEETSDYVKQGLEELRKATEQAPDPNMQSKNSNSNVFAEVYGDLFDVTGMADADEQMTKAENLGVNLDGQGADVFGSTVYDRSIGREMKTEVYDSRPGTIKRDTFTKSGILKSGKNIKFKTAKKLDEIREKCEKAGSKFVDLGRNIFAAYGNNDIIIVSEDKLRVADGTELLKGAKLKTVDLTGIDFSDCVQADNMLACSQIDTLILDGIQLPHMRRAEGFMYNATIKNISMKGFSAGALRNSYEMFSCLKTSKLDLTDSKFTSLISIEKMFWGAKIIDLNIGRLTTNTVVTPLAFAVSTIKNLKIDGLAVDTNGSDTTFLLAQVINPDIHNKDLEESYKNRGKKLGLGIESK